jgi:sugar lactone lactonase YvrE
MRKLMTAASTMLFVLIAASAWAGKVDTWRQNSTADFDKGKYHRTVATDRGQIRLSRELKPWSDLSAAFVWDLAHDKDGNLYAATGEEGKIIKVTPDGKSSVLVDTDEQHVFSLAVAADGTLYAGTAPNGLVLKITPDGKSATHFKTGKNYVWQLALDPQGVLYAATGTKAEIFKIMPDGTGASFYKAKQNHMLSLALGKDGSLYAGCDGDGLVYRINPQGKGFVVYDANQDEIRTLALADDGTLYVGTSSPAPVPPGRPPGAPLPAPVPPPPSGAGAAGGFESDDSAKKTQAGANPSTRPPTDGANPSQGATPKLAPGNNAVYRIGSDGSVRELFQDKVLVLSLARQSQRLLIGTGLSGQLFELDDAARERSEIGRIDHGEILAMAQRGDGTLVLGTGDPGKLYVLSHSYVAEGRYESQVFDAGMISRWGALRWQADTPEGTKVTLALRAGNTKTPDDTWTDWSPEQLDAQTAQVPCPPSRFLQFRATLQSARADATPALRSVAVRYMTTNQSPDVTKIEIPDVGEGDGSTRASKPKVKWEAKDSNNDEMEYTLYFRKEGWKDWVKLADKLTKKEFDWDTDSVPDGQYRLRIEAADRPDNPPESVLTGVRESHLFVVDHTPPAVAVKSADAKPGEITFEVQAADALVRIVGCSYSIDSGSWTKIFPIDQLFDSKAETFRFAPAELKPGNHLVMVRAVDAAGNVGTGDLVFTVESAAK